MERIEGGFREHPGVLTGLHCFMIVLYLTLIVVPPFLPTPPDEAGPLDDFVRFSQFVIWSVWWPFVVLSMVAFGRVWCGILCPEGALSAFAARYGSNRPIPTWMRWGGIPLVAFVALTVLGQTLEVDEKPLSQLVVLGGSTLAAVVVALLYRRNVWVWCRYLCPVSMLFGVFSRLGAMHFAVDRARMQTAGGSRSAAEHAHEPCPVRIHLPMMATNRHCLMCFRCAGWRDAIHLRLRVPGEELLRIRRAEPLFWEVVFLFGGAIGLPLGVFVGEQWDLDGIALVALLLASTGIGTVVLSLFTAASAFFLQRTTANSCGVLETFTQLGYVYAPLSLFSLFLGLSQPTFRHFEAAGLPNTVTFGARGTVLAVGTAWSLFLARRITAQHARGRRWAGLASLPLVAGILLVLGAWALVAIR